LITRIENGWGPVELWRGFHQNREATMAKLYREYGGGPMTYQMAAPTMREHRRGLEPKTERAEHAGLKVRKPSLPAESPREQPGHARDRQDALV
jgi:hypothetical protein